MRIMLLLLLLFACGAQSCDENMLFEQYKSSEAIGISGPFTINQLEKSNMIPLGETGETVPFGYINSEWQEFKAAYKTGDKIFFIKRIGAGYYMDGHFLVRNGCIIELLRGAIG